MDKEIATHEEKTIVQINNTGNTLMDYDIVTVRALPPRPFHIHSGKARPAVFTLEIKLLMGGRSILIVPFL